MARRIEIVEVSPRDGIQNEPTLLSLAQKCELISRAIDAGARRIEVTSFVNPKRVPQMADADQLAAALPRLNGVRYIGLALNPRGFERAMAAGLDEVNYVVAASDSFSERNQGVSVAEGIASFHEVAAAAQGRVPVGIVIPTCFGCPFEGEIELSRVLDVVAQCMPSQPLEIGLADTIGVATPDAVTQQVNAVREAFPHTPIRLHLHNTRNTGIANAWAGLQAGVDTLDASFGGVGGCPFAPNATGNIATEDLLYLLERSGVETGLSLSKSIDTARWLEAQLGKTSPGMVMKAGGFPAATSDAGSA